MSTRQGPEHPAVTKLRNYLRIPTVHPNINYDECVDFLKELANDVQLPVRCFEIVPGKPIVVMTWQGKHPGLPSILLNSHMDVVPVYREKWIHDPFSAEKDASGNIYGRGSQDMKSVGIMYVEAVRRLKNDGIQLDRTVYISFVPDEEIGSEDGMKKWVETDDFRRMNIDCGLDESCASPLKDIIVYNAEKSTWYFNIHCTGQPSHSAMLQSNTAPEKLRYIIDAFMDFRQKEKDKLPNVPKPELFLGDITCVNMTMINGGIQGNIVPAEMVVSFDCRISIDTDHEEFERWINDVCKKAGDGVHVEFVYKNPKYPSTKLDGSNPYWISLKSACEEMGINLKPIICAGTTDARFMRKVGISAFGFTPLTETPPLLHDNNEFINEDKFLKGIDIYYNVIKSLSNTKPL